VPKAAQNRFRLTDKAVAKLTAPGRYYDDAQPALLLEVGENGSKVWSVYKYSKVKRAPISRAIGSTADFSYTQAKTRADAILADIANDVVASTRGQMTLGELAKAYAVYRRGQRDRTEWAADIFRVSFKGWDDRKIGDITRQDVVRHHNAIAADPKRGPDAAGRAVKLLRTLYRYATEQLEAFDRVCPAGGIKLKESKPRRRALTEAEEARVWTALDDPIHAAWVPDYFRLALLTGARRSNVCGMRWADLDLGSATWLIPAAAFKTGEPTEVVLVPEVVEILTRRRASIDGEWVFPSRKSGCGHLVEPYFAWKDVLRIAQVEGVTIHDLRRTYGMRMVKRGVPITLIAAALGHRNPQTTVRSYAHATTDAVREAVLRVHSREAFPATPSSEATPGA
jgi:integrase